GGGERPLADRLAETERHPRGDIRKILPQNEDRVGALDLGERRRMGRAVSHDLEDQSQEAKLRVGDAGEKTVGTDGGPEREVRLQRRAGRADPDDPAGPDQPAEVLNRFPLRNPNLFSLPRQKRLPDPLRAVDMLVAIAAPVAEKVAVDLRVIAVDVPPQRAVPLA